MASSTSPPPPSDLLAPSETIERVLFVTSKVHVYSIPPLSNNRGYEASTWTSPPSREIFVAQLRIFESSSPDSESPSKAPKSKRASFHPPLNVSVRLEDPSNGDLFAAAPYTSPAVVEAAVDSSRFFTIRVEDESGRRAFLGLGFEERSEALDFSIALQEARKVLGIGGTSQPGTPKSASTRDGLAAKSGGRGEVEEIKGQPTLVHRDWSLKEGETLHIDIGGKKSGVRRDDGSDIGSSGAGGKIEPPSGGGQLSATATGFGLLPPPPSTQEAKKDRRRSREVILDAETKKLEALGFDDGEFGEFQ